MAFGNVRGLGAWGVAFAASVALHLVVIAVITISGKIGGTGDRTPPPPQTQTDGRAQDLPRHAEVEQTASSSSDGSDSSAVDGKANRPLQSARGRQRDSSRSAKSETQKSDSRRTSTARDDRAGSSESAKDGWKSYRVKPGDSLTKIARVCGCSVAELAKANGLSVTASLKFGQTIKVKNMPADVE